MWQEGIAVGFFIAAIVLLVFWPQVVESRRLYWGDIDLYFTPSLTFLRGNMQQGIIPLWNSRMFCGTPYVGNPQTWPFYPGSFLLNWLNVAKFINWSIGIHVYIAGIGAYILSRRTCRLSVGGALLAAIVFMLGGQLVSKEQFPAMVQAISWIPWLLWATARLMRRRTPSNAVTLGILGGLEILSGHGQITVIGTYLCVAIFLAGIWINRKGGWRGAGVSVLMGIAAAVLAICISAVQTLPMVSFMSLAARQTLNLHTANRFYLPLNQLPNFVLPTLHGHPLHGTWMGRMNFWETSCYVGFVPALLALFGAAQSLKDKRPYGPAFWSVTMMLAIWLSLGRKGGLYTAAYFTLPLLRSFHDPARFLVLGCLAIALLAGFGMDAVKAQVRRLKPFRNPNFTVPLVSLALLVATAVDLGHFDRNIYPLIPGDYKYRRLSTELLALHDNALRTHQARFMAPDTATTWQVFTSYHDYHANWPGYFSAWYDTATPNLYMSNGLDDAFGYDPFMPKSSEDVAGIASLSLLDNAPPEIGDRAAQLGAALGVRWIVLYRRDYPEPELPGFTEISAPAPAVDLNGRYIPKTYLLFDNMTVGRARFTNSFICFASKKAAQAYLSDTIVGKTNTDLSETVILDSPVAMHAGRMPYVVPVKLREIGPDALTMRFKAHGPGMLVLADTALPGWQATTDGTASKMLVGDSMIRVVPIARKGWHTINMTYNPEPFRVGLYVSLVMSCFLSAWFVAAFLSRSRSN